VRLLENLLDRLCDALDWAFGPVETPSMAELFPPPPGFLEHKDHLSLCPECRRHYLCREIVCRLVCARCGPAAGGEA